MLVGVIVAGFAFQVCTPHPDGAQRVEGPAHTAVRRLRELLLAAGILGATVMPHVIYLHSALTQRRVSGAKPDERRRIFRFELIDVIIAMTIAGLINMACS